MSETGTAKKSIFVAYTPYHVFLALLMALESREKGAEQQLVIFTNFADAQLLYESLVKSRFSPFSKVRLLKGEYGLDQFGFLKRGYERFIVEKRICKELLKVILDEEFQQIFLFNEDRPSSLYLIKKAESIKGKLRVSFVEDGAVSYNMYYVQKPLNYLFWGKIFYGLWWRNIKVMGTSEVFDSVWALFPEFIREELRHKKIERIPVHRVTDISDSGIAAEILTHYGLNPEEVKGLNCIILLSHSSVIGKFPDYRATLLKVFQKAQELGYSVAIKYHPRDTGDFLDLLKDPKISCLRSSVPLEFIFLQAKESLRLVVADMSTVPLTASLILPKAQVVSTGLLIGSKDERFIRLLKSLNVKLPGTFEEFNSCIV